MEKEIKKAICPRCHKQWVWDWTNDIFCFENGVEVKCEEVIIGKDQLYVWICDCGKINAVELHDDDGSEILDGGDFTKVDWEAEENSYKN